MYCGDVGLTAPSGPCSPGFYCTLGSMDAVARNCDARRVICDTPSCYLLRPRAGNASCGAVCPIG
eukprot:2370447-Rhodomonas_salina.1